MKILSKKELKKLFKTSESINNVYQDHIYPDKNYPHKSSIVIGEPLGVDFLKHLQLHCKIPMWYTDPFGISCNDAKAVNEIHKKKLGQNTYTYDSWVRNTNWGIETLNGIKFMLVKSSRGTHLDLLPDDKKNIDIDWKLIVPAMQEVIDYLYDTTKWYEDIK